MLVFIKNREYNNKDNKNDNKYDNKLYENYNNSISNIVLSFSYYNMWKNICLYIFYLYRMIYF